MHRVKSLKNANKLLLASFTAISSLSKAVGFMEMAYQWVGMWWGMDTFRSPYTFDNYNYPSLRYAQLG
jgi:hypothetical protein